MFDDEQPFHLPPPELPDLEPISCELANGHTLKLAARLWQRWRTYEDWIADVWPEPYFAIRLYCTENALPKRLVWTEEFREQLDFDAGRIPEIWQWLEEFTASRAIFNYDTLDEFVEELAERLAQFSAGGEDTVEHLQELPWLSAPDWFDRVDDSVFTDQNDAETDGPEAFDREEESRYNGGNDSSPDNTRER